VQLSFRLPDPALIVEAAGVVAWAKNERLYGNESYAPGACARFHCPVRAITSVVRRNTAQEYLERRARSEQAVEQNRQHDCGEDHVQAVVLGGETPDGKSYARHGRGDQEKQS
jgi:hypothetical protein